jgi:hypothetical protein
MMDTKLRRLLVMVTGRRYHETQGLSLPEIAQRMRADVAQLRTDQGLPEHAVIAVRTDQKGTGSGSIHITVSGLRDAEVWRTPGVTEHTGREAHWGGLTPLGRQITDALEQIHSAYNYDNSDTMADYWDVRYFGSVHIRSEQAQQWQAEQKGKQQARAAANRAERQAAEALPLRAAIVGDRSPRLVITDSRTGQAVIEIAAPRGYTRELLTTSYVTYLLEAHGWTVARYHRRSRTNPTAYWSVTGTDETDPGDQSPAPNDHQAEQARTSEPAPDDIPPAPIDIEGQDQDAAAASLAVEWDVANWFGLDPDHWAARWVRATATMPAEDPARVWSRAIAILIAHGYRHERHDRPGHVDHTERVALTDARADVADEATELARHAAAARDALGSRIPLAVTGQNPQSIKARPSCGPDAVRPTIPAPRACPLALFEIRQADTTAPAPPSRALALFQLAAVGIGAVDRTNAPTGSYAEQGHAQAPDEFDGAEILHTAATGTLLLGTAKGDGTYDALRTAGQRWRGLRHGDYTGALFLPYTRDRAADRYTIDRAAQILRATGWRVRVSVDDTPRDQAQVAADRRERATDRAERLRDLAARRFANSDAAHDRADQIGERFAGGQPILVGHHSEQRARRDRDRMHAAMDRACAQRAEGERLTDAADAAQHAATRQDSGPRIARRIDRATADEARITRALNGYTRRYRYGTGHREEQHAPATGTYRDQLLGQLAHVRAALTADRQALADMVAAGTWRPIDPTTIRPGDAIRTRGRWEKVVRVNRTTVSVDTGYSWTDRVPFAEITHHRAAPTT